MQLPIKAEHRISVSPAAALPLSTLLSQVLVAYTIEFDNEFERQMPHRTTNYGSTAGSRHAPWLVSLAMWSNCMQFIGKDGVRVGELEHLARTTTNLEGMEKWGYVVVQPDPSNRRPKPPRSDWIIRLTPAGQKAQAIWRPLFSVIEKRWQARFGKKEIDQLRESLWTLISQIDVEMPDCLPILDYGLFSRVLNHERRIPAEHEDGSSSGFPLSTRLSRVLLAFAIEFECESGLSLAISANVLRVLDGKGVRVRDLPLMTGISKEAISMTVGVLQKSGVAVIEPDPINSRTKLVRLTPMGQKAQNPYRHLLGAIEDRWQARFGMDTIRTLRKLLEQLVSEPTSERSPLFRGLEPHPGGWRASVRKPDTLPHYPMVLHRGGYPDGS